MIGPVEFFYRKNTYEFLIAAISLLYHKQNVFEVGNKQRKVLERILAKSRNRWSPTDIRFNPGKLI